MRPRWWIVPAALAAGLIAATMHSMSPLPGRLSEIVRDSERAAITDRNGVPLGVSYQNRWNSFDYVPLHAIPDFLLQAILTSEDRHFYQHHGVDFAALAGAAWQDVKSRSRVRGGSTISEQVVRILHPRPRTLWSKWVELWEALLLESRASKGEILEFYCNELPYASNRRGVVQAASHYFDRDLSTLTRKEMLALVVLARAPSGYDLYRDSQRVEPAIGRLAQAMDLPPAEREEIAAAPLVLDSNDWSEDAPHFVSWLRRRLPREEAGRTIRSTLDIHLQRLVRDIVAERLRSLSKLTVGNAAAIVVDHRSNEVLAWVVVGGTESLQHADDAIDAVVSPRQPGSALKPFLYAAALDQGWSPATMLDDSPMAETIGSGLHEFKNYSRSFYGRITLREALGNSLNIPALRTIGFVGPAPYLDRLHRLGFASLNRDVSIYKEGLALGNGEVTLFEMAQGYAALAEKGVFRPLKTVQDEAPPERGEQVYSPEAASLIGNILSDPLARHLEFGYSSVLNLPVQTAVKTGTSTDYRDAWTMGFDSRYVVGIWMGNLDRSPMDGVTGAVGPALALRSIFAELHLDERTQPLYLSPRLVRKEVCLKTDAETGCTQRSEFFLSGTEESSIEPPGEPPIELSRPTQGLQMAFDPRIPPELQSFDFRIDGLTGKCEPSCTVDWRLNGARLATTDGGDYRWPVRRGKYDLRAEVHRGGELLFASGDIHFQVK